jgi:acyl-CoA hydrolase
LAVNPVGGLVVDEDKTELTTDELIVAEAIRGFLRRDCLVALSDGAGAPIGIGRALAHAARQVGGIRLLLGWSFERPVPMDNDAFTDVRVMLGGYALRSAFRSPFVRYLPLRMSNIPAAMRSALKADVLIAGVRPTPGGLGFATEVAWMRSVVDSGARVLGEVNHGLSACSADPAIPAHQVTVIGEINRPPIAVASHRPTDLIQQVGAQVAALVTPGSVIQYGPGSVGSASLAALEVPVHVHSGIVTDAVVGLDRRGLLLGDPVASYVAGSPELYQWAEGRAITLRTEEINDFTRLRSRPLFAINTALEVDLSGQVNVEGFGTDTVGSVGGHPDFAAVAARQEDGLSIVAVPTMRGSHRTLVERLSCPASTIRSDIDVIVTEHGVADLRGLDDSERAASLIEIWGSAPATNQQ